MRAQQYIAILYQILHVALRRTDVANCLCGRCISSRLVVLYEQISAITMPIGINGIYRGVAV